MKKSILRVLGFILLFLTACTQVPQDSSSSSTSIPTSQNLKSYMGAASIGDIVWYGIDSQSKSLMFSNITRGYTWSSTYTEQSDGSMKFTIPVINKEAYFIEIPDKLLVVIFEILDQNTNYPAFAILVPQTINSREDMTNLNSAYFFLEAERISDGEYKGLYNLYPCALLLTPSNVTKYNGDNGILTNEGTIPIYFSDSEKACYAVVNDGGMDHTNYFYANNKTFVLDRGLNRGFAFGSVVRTNEPSTTELVGNYVFMIFSQGRDAGQTNLRYNEVNKGWVTLSNTGSYLDVYVGSNLNSLDRVDTVTNFRVYSTDSKINAYCLLSTNASEDSPLVIVLGDDLNYAFLVEDDGNPTDTNSDYRVQFGFIKKVNQ